MRKKSVLLFLSCIGFISFYKAQLSTTNLPIVKIFTEDDIPDEPKSLVQLVLFTIQLEGLMLSMTL